MSQPPVRAITEAAWPPESLQSVGRCPLCEGLDRSVLHSDLTDRLFLSSSHKWALMQCGDCRCAYLDPRPDPDSIGKAYARYFTHDEPTAASGATVPHSLAGRLRSWLKAGLNGYRNARWGTHLAPAHAWGKWCVPLIWPLRSLITVQMRHMPRRPARGRNRLLDVGCGDGAFLELARSAGWQVHGLDFDPLAVAAARRRGLDVQHGSLDNLDPSSGLYDWITCSHVLEHVHDPLNLLRGMATHLSAGGTLWLQTPNVESAGHAIFGRNWRGIEPPRHLVIFTPAALGRWCHESGLAPQFRPLPAIAALAVYSNSAALRDGRTPPQSVQWRLVLHPRYVLASLWQAFAKNRAEFITLTAQKIEYEKNK